MSNFLTGMQLALGGACIWLLIQVGRQAARQATRQWRDHAARAGRLAHPGPVCLVRHDHKGRQLADLFRMSCAAGDADQAAMCRAFAAATRIAVRRHGAHAADVLLCDLDGAVRELMSTERTDVPQ